MAQWMGKLEKLGHFINSCSCYVFYPGNCLKLFIYLGDLCPELKHFLIGSAGRFALSGINCPGKIIFSHSSFLCRQLGHKVASWCTCRCRYRRFVYGGKDINKASSFGWWLLILGREWNELKSSVVKEKKSEKRKARFFFFFLARGDLCVLSLVILFYRVDST